MDDDADNRPTSLSSVCACTPVRRGNKLPTTHNRQAERVVLRVAQRAFASVYVGRLAEAHGAGDWTWLPHMSEVEFDAGTRCAAGAVDEALCMGAPKRKRRARRRDVQVVP